MKYLYLIDVFFTNLVFNIVEAIKYYTSSYCIIINNFIWEKLLVKFPNFKKLISDLINLYKNNRIFILYLIKIYFYISLLLYAISFILIFISLSSNNLYILSITKFFVTIYNIWTYPFSKFRFILKIIIQSPFKIMFIIIDFLLYILNNIKNIGKNEAMGKDEKSFNQTGMNPNIGRTVDLSSTEWELNCAENKFLKGLKDAKNKFGIAALSMDHSDNFPKVGSQIVNEYKLREQYINNYFWCPNYHERKSWNDNRQYSPKNIGWFKWF